MSFVHLHIHSEYSLLDGALRIEALLDFVKSQGHTACALTDHTTMFGAIEFYSECKARGLKAILGCEIFFEGFAGEFLEDEETPDSEAEPSHQEALAGEPRPQNARHLVLLAKDLDGYRNLIKIISSPFLDGESPAVPVIKRSVLAEYSKGIIALSACALGEFGALTARFVGDQNPSDAFGVAEDNPVYEAMQAHVSGMRELFGEDYYIELIDNGLPEQRTLIEGLVAGARHFGLPVVAGADAHYLKPTDADAHSILMAIKNDMTTRDLNRRRKDVRFHVLSNEEAAEIFAPWPEALANTINIAEKCNVEFKFGKYYLPKFPVAPGETLEDAMERLSREGLEERLVKLRVQYGAAHTPEREQEFYHKRLAYELSIIRPMGFAGYFLIVQDFINWAKRHGIPVGPGRGSGAGSLVAYSLRITDLDPIENGLVFERFLNPERISMPDFDVDFCQDRRDEVIRYVIEKYGSNNVAQITTFGKMLAKAAIRDVGRALELGFKRVDKIAKLIPNELGITLDDAMTKEPRLNEEAAADSLVAELLSYARQLEGLTRHSSVHAAGIVISDGPMVNYVPVYRTEGTGLITQFEMSHVEKVGLVKFDFLGLKTLTVIDQAVKFVRAVKNPTFNIEDISLADAKVYKDISSANTTGIFQLESTGMQQLVGKLKPSQFGDLVALVALFRPGPLGSGMVDDFIERKHGRAAIQYPVPQLSEILKETYGIVLYQEQVMQTAALLASYSLGEADLLRRAMGKKKPEEMAKQKTRFVDGAVKNGLDAAKADEIFELLAKFAEYGFNKSHSAAYGLVSYQTAFLKTHFSAEFMAAIMTCDADNTDKVVRYVQECRRLGLKLLPPCINHSDFAFTIPEDRTIRFGLGAVKGVGAGSLTALFEERAKGGDFLTLEDLSERVDLRKVGKKTLELLTAAGGLDTFGADRGKILESLDKAVRQSESLRATAGQKTLFGLVATPPKRPPAGEIAAPLPTPKPILNMERLLAERKVLGVFLSAHPLDLYPEDVKAFGKNRLKSVPSLEGKGKIAVPAFLSAVEERLSKKGHRLIFVSLDDPENSLEAMISNREITAANMLPEPNQPVIVVGQVDAGFEPGTYRFRVERVLSLEAVRKERIKRLIINVSATESNRDGPPEDLLAVKRTLLEHPGKTAVQFAIAAKDYRVLVDATGFNVEMSDALLAALKKGPLDLNFTYVI